MTFDPLTLTILISAIACIAALGQALVGAQRRRVMERLQIDALAASERFASACGRRDAAGLADSLAAQIPQLPVEAARLDQELARAGFYGNAARRNYLAVRNTSTILPVLIAGVALVLLAPPGRVEIGIVGLGAVAASLGFCLPRFYVRGRGNRRVRRIERGVPDALDIVTMCLTGGMNLQESLDRVSTELDRAHPELAMELRIVLAQSELGALEQGLRQFAVRTGSADVKSLTSLWIQSDRLGTDIAQALQEYTDVLRQRRRQQADERANRATVKMLFPLVLCLAPSVFLLLLGPAALDIRAFFIRERSPNGILSQQEIGAAVSSSGDRVRNSEQAR